MSRKRANKNTTPTIQEFKKDKVLPLNEREGQYFKALADASSRVANSMKQKAQFEFIIQQIEKTREKIVKGEISLPVHITLIPKLMTYEESDKKKVLKMFDEQLNAYKQSLLAVNGQISHQHEEYVEIGIRVRDFMIKKYGAAKAEQIAIDPAKRTPTDDEVVLFEGEFDQLMKEKNGKPNPNYDPKKAEEFEKAKKLAVETNKRLRQKKSAKKE